MTEIREDIKGHLPLLEILARGSDYVLEIGPAYGNGSTMALKQCPGIHIAVDISCGLYPDCVPTGDNFKLVIGDSRDTQTRKNVEAQARLLGYKGRPDVIFIDTIHTYEHMKAELEVWGSYAKSDTMWVFHDTWMLGKYNHMTDAVKEWADTNGWVFYDYTKNSNGLGLMVKV